MSRATLKELGYSNSQIETIISSMFTRNIEDELLKRRFKDNFDFFSKFLNISDEIIRKNTTKEPILLTRPSQNLKSRIDDWIEYGLTIDELMDMFKKNASFLTYDLNIVKDKFRTLGLYGFTKEILLKIVKKFPSFLGQAEETLTKRIDDIKKLGDYTDEDIIAMVSDYPQLLSLDFETNIKVKYATFQSAKYSKEEIHIITVSYPTAYGNSEKTLASKLSAIAEGGLKSDILTHPRNLIQSATLTRARTMYFTDHFTEVGQVKGTFIFSNDANFRRITNLTKKELLEKYKERLGKVA